MGPAARRAAGGSACAGHTQPSPNIPIAASAARVKVLTYPGLEAQHYTVRMGRVTALVAAMTIAMPALASAEKPLAMARVTRPKKPVSPPAIKATEEEGEPCLGILIPPSAGSPFLPGEELTYELSVAGVTVGKLELKAGKPRMVEGAKAESFFGRARTKGLAATLKNFEGRYMAVVEPKLYHPLELRSETTVGDDPRHEIARFSRDFRGVSANYRINGKSEERSYARDRPIYDMLTLLYQSRRLDLSPGTKICQEVYADKRMWRVDAEVMGVQSLRTPVGVKNALRVKTTWERMPHPDFDPKKEAPKFEIDMFYTTDAFKAPLAFEARTKEITARGDLVRWATADREQEASWGF